MALRKAFVGLLLAPLTVLAGPAAPSASSDPILPGTAANCVEYHDVVSGDGCSGIIQKYPPLTSAQFYSYNPYLHTSCDNLLLGFRVCVKINGPTPSFSSTSTKASKTTTGPAPTSTDPKLPGSASNCVQWHDVSSGDGCSGIVSEYPPLTSAQFFSYNPYLHTNCDNLLLGFAVCVKINGPTPSFTSTASKTTSGPSPTSTDPKLPGSACNCVTWHDVVSGDGCSGIVQEYPPLSSSQFFSYNPYLHTNCDNLLLGFAVCVKISGAQPSFCSTTSTPTVTTPTINTSPYSPIGATKTSTYTPRNTTTSATGFPPTPTQSGIPSTCNKYYQVGQYDTCDKIASLYQSWIDVDDLIKMNPALGQNCTGLLVGYYVCVGMPMNLTLPGNTTVTQSFPAWSPPTGTTATPQITPSPIQSGIISGCVGFYQAQSSDNCAEIASMYYISPAALEQWNPALGSDCHGLVPGDFYCVGNSTATSATVPTVTTTPTPMQTGTAGNCQAWYKSTPGDDCEVITWQFGTFNESQFISWNPAVGQNCTGLVIGDWYCVRVPGTPTAAASLMSFAPLASGAVNGSIPSGTTRAPPAPTPSATTAPHKRRIVEGARDKYGRKR